MTRRYAGFIWAKAFHWFEVLGMKFSVPVSPFSAILHLLELRYEKREPGVGYHGVGTLTFRVHTIYVRAR